MAEREFDSSAFDAAALQAKGAWDKMLAEMKPEERAAAIKIQGWWKSWYMTAGHRRLGRIISGTFK